MVRGESAAWFVVNLPLSIRRRRQQTMTRPLTLALNAISQRTDRLT